MRTLCDLDWMPFGKYSSGPDKMRMQDVPASYLHYLWHNGLKLETKTSNVADYIKRNIEAFKKENPDLIWD